MEKRGGKKSNRKKNIEALLKWAIQICLTTYREKKFRIKGRVF